MKRLITAAKNYEIGKKITSFSGDNAPVNFGNSKRTGSTNVFKQLKQKVNINMIGSGCTAHILHNAMRHACDQLTIDVEYIAVKIYTHFYRHTARLRKLKEFCDSIGEAYVKLHGYIKTRFLALKECLSSIISNFDGLNEYFHSFDAPVKIVEFFDDLFALATLIFVRDQTENFQSSILQLEGDCIYAVDTAITIDALKTSIQTRMENRYYSLDFRAASEQIDENLLVQKQEISNKLMDFLRTTLENINEWTGWLDDVKLFSWVRLNASINWNEVECAALWMISRKYFAAEEMDKLFNQFAILDSFLKQNSTSINGEKTTDKKWVRIFRHFTEKSLPFSELLKVIEFALNIPACNTTAERVFAHINDIWTPEKEKLTMQNVRALLMVKFNWKGTFLEFNSKIKNDAAFLQKVAGVKKYNMKAADLFPNKVDGAGEK